MKKKYILGAFNIWLYILLSILFIVGLVEIGIISIPKTIFVILAILISIGILAMLYLDKDVKVYNVTMFVTLLLNVVLAYNVFNYSYNYDYMNNLLHEKYNYEEYNVYVLKSTIYHDLDRLENKKIGMLETNHNNIQRVLKGRINIEFKTYKTMDEIYTALDNGEKQSFISTEKDLNKASIKNVYVKSVYSTKIKVNI